MAITSQQLAEIQNRLSRKKRGVAPASLPERNQPSNVPHVVLGIDPSLRGTGYGVISGTKNKLISVTHGTIKCPQIWKHSKCLASIASNLREVIKKHPPTIVVVEGLFFAQNLKTAIIMGEARGAAMSVVGEASLEVYEIAPRKVKQAIVGYGAAQKFAVAKMVQRMLKLEDQPDPDAADALALAITLVQELSSYRIQAPKTI